MTEPKLWKDFPSRKRYCSEKVGQETIVKRRVTIVARSCNVHHSDLFARRTVLYGSAQNPLLSVPYYFSVRAVGGAFVPLRSFLLFVTRGVAGVVTLISLFFDNWRAGRSLLCMGRLSYNCRHGFVWSKSARTCYSQFRAQNCVTVCLLHGSRQPRLGKPCFVMARKIVALVHATSRRL